MTTWIAQMNIEFVAEPIVSLDEKMLGVELLTRFTDENARVISPEYVIAGWTAELKRSFLYEQFSQINHHAQWFDKHGLSCSVNIDHMMAVLLLNDAVLQSSLESLPFVTLEITEHFPNLEQGIQNPVLRGLKSEGFSLWLDDLGAGNANVAALVSGCFDVVKLDRCFFREQIQKPTFPILISNIKKYCDKIVIEGVEDRQYINLLRGEDIWGLQGYLFKSVPFHKVEKLI